MKFHWRSSETDPKQKLAGPDGFDQLMDGTPVAMFHMVSRRKLGLTMRDLGELVHNHNQILHEGSVMPAAERKIIEHERRLARESAEAISHLFNEPLDERLDTYEPHQEETPGAAQKSVYDSLMKRMRDRKSQP